MGCVALAAAAEGQQFAHAEEGVEQQQQVDSNDQIERPKLASRKQKPGKITSEEVAGFLGPDFRDKGIRSSWMWLRVPKT